MSAALTKYIDNQIEFYTANQSMCSDCIVQVLREVKRQCETNASSIAFEVPDNSSDDIKFITILGKSLEMFLHVPPGHLRAALNWFDKYSESRIEEYQKQEARHEVTQTLP